MFELDKGMPELPRKLQEIAYQIGLGEADVPTPVKFPRADPLGIFFTAD